MAAFLATAVRAVAALRWTGGVQMYCMTRPALDVGRCLWYTFEQSPRAFEGSIRSGVALALGDSEQLLESAEVQVGNASLCRRRRRRQRLLVLPMIGSLQVVLLNDMQEPLQSKSLLWLREYDTILAALFRVQVFGVIHWTERKGV
ncbi:hypothetical protein Efla_005343 [Eimeria flavescens]